MIKKEIAIKKGNKITKLLFIRRLLDRLLNQIRIEVKIVKIEKYKGFKEPAEFELENFICRMDLKSGEIRLIKEYSSQNNGNDYFTTNLNIMRKTWNKIKRKFK